jgi:hypothetical protein
MKHAKKRIEPSIKVFLTRDEMIQYERFLAPFAGKKGPFLKQLLLREIAKPTGGTK